MQLGEDAIQDVAAEGLKPIFTAYVGNVSGGMSPQDATAHFRRAFAIWREAVVLLRETLDDASN